VNNNEKNLNNFTKLYSSLSKLIVINNQKSPKPKKDEPKIILSIFFPLKDNHNRNRVDATNKNTRLTTSDGIVSFGTQKIP
jgi:hypothetical protein